MLGLGGARILGATTAKPQVAAERAQNAADLLEAELLCAIGSPVRRQREAKSDRMRFRGLPLTSWAEHAE
jgi:hypothetical protein